MKQVPMRMALGLITAMVLGGAHGVTAADNQLITSVALIHEYNDNLRLDHTDELSDNITTVAPKLELVHNSERYRVRADGRLDFYRYEEYDQFDDTDQWYNGFLDATPTERWRFGAEAHFSDDNRPDRDIQETGLVLSNIRRKRINAGTSAEYTFSEMLAGGLVLEFNREDFDDPETSDRRDYHVVLGLTRSLDAWLARTTGRLNLGYSHYEFEREFDRTGTLGFLEVTTLVEDRSEVDYYSLTAGTDTALTEKVNLSVDLGGRYAQSQRELQVSRSYVPPLITEAPLITDEDYDSFGFVGSLTFTYRGERSRSDVFLSHDLTPVSGSNATANRTIARVSGSLRLLERLHGNVYFQWYQNLSEQDDPTQQDIDTQTWNAGGGLRWTLNDYLDLAANYVYTIVDNREAGTTAYRNLATLQLEAHHDWLE
ncbi:outer membrane beta-barrel protein [Desulfosarcina sp.]|uniref:outer membrane beta-barrel protein n=1 Tax=Desulfosarcina sp. TaxID=2027861 RepID=UPI003970C627